MRVAVLGLGLIGGSVALALGEKMHGSDHEVIGYDPDPGVRAAVAGRFTAVADPAELLDSDIAVVATPYEHVEAVARDVLPAETYRGLITDVASVKAAVRRRFRGHARFVGGHPMAGKETAGFASAEPGLFAGRKWVLCIEEDTKLRDWVALARLWIAIGATVVPTTAAAHDAAVAKSSHIEHIVAAALTLNAADPLTRTLGAGSFRDATRVAASAPELIEGMVAGNRLGVLEALREFERSMDAARTLIGRSAATDMAGRDSSLRGWLSRANELRASWPPEPGEPERMELTRDGLLALGEAGGWVESIQDNEVAMVRRPRVKSTS
ncbi:prephenate dehydrogenase/arogenate dehydrogenase family protein [Glycomyces sp. L485]|uniref:prephenate dehydrogenase n=1 Tax=Glycomyces sp. L485 TaxID=2909235 RepID=UPI001F4A98FA|nr:prephenate dehydrogenase/arogenate dehydrogenase family protein [Glycomyces sp. L485]MCH7229412.1 prephenate dehydrogenase/arogenate dehydrogenase family protein [Glycomyces sp. L485]